MCPRNACSRQYIRSLAQDEDLPVPSPTFLLQNTYDLGDEIPPVHHYDLYRLKGQKDLARLDMHDSFKSTVTLVEWPDRVDLSILPESRLELWFSIMGDDTQQMIDSSNEELNYLDDGNPRSIECRGYGQNWASSLATLLEHVRCRGHDIGLTLIVD